MDLKVKFAAFAASKWYWPAVAAVSAFAGIGVGISVDRLTAGEDGEEPVEAEGPGKPVVVSERSSLEEPEVSSAFKKPDISKLMPVAGSERSSLIDYTKFYESATGKKAGEDDQDGDVPTSQFPEQQPVFEIISEDEFIAATGNEDGYVTATGTFFPESRVLAGWNDKAEPKEVKDTIGEYAAAMFEDENVGAVYVRNTALKVLYEVIRGVGLYEDEG